MSITALANGFRVRSKWSFTAILLTVHCIQEGPHSALNEDEFFDALEMAYQQDEMVLETLRPFYVAIVNNVGEKSGCGECWESAGKAWIA